MKKRRKKEQPASPSRDFSWRDFWRTWWQGKAPVVLFAAKFGGLIVLLYALLALPIADQMLYGYLKVNAWLSNVILNLLGQGTYVLSDVEIASRSSPFAIAIRRGCDAVEPTWLLCAAIVAFPGPWKRKLVGMLVGTVVLQLLNLVRIVTLYIVGIHFNSMFDSMHLEVWPALFIIAAIALFVGWKGWAHEE